MYSNYHNFYDALIGATKTRSFCGHFSVVNVIIDNCSIKRVIFNVFLISKTKAIIKVSSNCVVVSMTCSFCCYQGKGYWLLYQLLFRCPVTECVEFAWQRAGHACVRCCARGSSRFSIIT